MSDELRGLDGARKMLEAMGDFEENEVFPNNAARVQRIEAALPQVRFTRHHDGSVINFGLVPEQATGTIDGLPFYYRFRHDSARLSVYPARVGNDVFAPEDMPTLGVHEVLVAHEGDVTGNEYAGLLDDDEGVALFLRLVEGLRVPQGEDTYHLRIAAQREMDGPANSGTVLAQAVLPLLAGAARIDLPEVQDRCGEAMLVLPSGVSVGLRQRDTLTPDPSLVVTVFTPDAKPFSRHDSVLVGNADIPRVATPEEIVASFKIAVAHLSDDSSYANHTSQLDPADRRQRQEAAVAARNEIGRMAGVGDLTSAEAKAMVARSTKDKIDLLREAFNS